MTRRDDETLSLGTDRDAGPRARGELILCAVGDGVFATFALPASGALVIGRGKEADIRIDDPSISRQHAILQVTDGRVTIADAGSANGTRLNGRVMAEGKGVELRPGQPVELGTVMIALQPARSSARPRRIWSHDYFEARLEEECARAVDEGEMLAVVRVRVAGPDPENAQTALSAILGPADAIGRYGPAELELLLTGVDRAGASERLDRARAQLPSGVTLEHGIAILPEDGGNAGALIAQACDAVKNGARMPVEPVLVGHGPMHELHRMVERIARGQISVLILGETGVGKEVMAEAIHQLSARASRPFLRLNCASLSESLLESELFGHEAGAFTGAARSKPGLLETADGGTVFLDEVGELPAALQVKLLRVLEERSVRRVGGLDTRGIDVRFVAATNRDLEEEIASGRFREDLYFRLNGISLWIPPLRDRRGEIRPLAEAFLRRAASGDPPPLTDAAMKLLESYAWPGNVRELRNFMERAVLLSGGEPIEPHHLPVEKMRAQLLETPPDPSLKGELGAIEQQRILDALDACDGNQTRAAKKLGIARGTLLARLDKYGIPRPKKG